MIITQRSNSGSEIWYVCLPINIQRHNMELCLMGLQREQTNPHTLYTRADLNGKAKFYSPLPSVSNFLSRFGQSPKMHRIIYTKSCAPAKRRSRVLFWSCSSVCLSVCVCLSGKSSNLLIRNWRTCNLAVGTNMTSWCPLDVVRFWWHLTLKFWPCQPLYMLMVATGSWLNVSFVA